MPIDIYEKQGSRTGTAGNQNATQRNYILRGSDDDAELKAALLAEAPLTIATNDSPPKTLARDFISLDDQLSDGLWEGSAHYRDDGDVLQLNQSQFSFDTTGGTLHITQSKGTTKYPGTAPDLKGAIGATADGVEGVDITIPQYAFSETHYLPHFSVDDAYKGKLFRLTGKVCNAPFKGGLEGEILFLGARGQRTKGGDWEITFNFAGSPNVTNLTIGDITGIAKKGWQYLWVRYVAKEAGAGADKIITQVPKAVYVEDVYEAGNFVDLGIGV